jgi:hypothetical protein
MQEKPNIEEDAMLFICDFGSECENELNVRKP